MTVYVKELKESFFTRGDTLPHRTRQMVMGYFMDEESCRRDSEAERDFYTSKNHYSDLFSKYSTIYMNTTINDRNHYTKMTYSWSPISLLEVNHRGLNAEEYYGADNCEGKKLKDSGYCNLNFDWSSSGLSRSCQNCGNEEFMDDYWDSQRISMSEPEEGKILCSMTEWNGGRDENDLGYCSFDFNYGSDGAFSECEFCGTEVMATFDNSFYDDDDDDDDEFESEFSKGDMLNLKKYIDYPMRWIDKNIRPSSDAKVRKIEQKSKGQIPTKKTTDSFRQKIETPNWFKAVQVGILASVVGVMYFKDSGAIEEPEEPEEQKEE
jgi:hypothetical protein